MKKHYGDCSIIDRITKKYKKKQKMELLFNLIVIAVFYGIFTKAAISSDQSFSLKELLFAPLIPLIIIGASVYSFVNYRKPIKEIKQSLSLGADEELEAILKECEIIDERIAVSDRYVLDLKTGTAVRTDQINGIKQSTSRAKNSTYYNIELSLINQKPATLSLDTPSLCDAIQYHIEKAIDNNQRLEYHE